MAKSDTAEPNTDQVQEDTKEEATEEITFPRTVNGKVFNTPEELRKYATELQENLKAMKDVIKQTGGSKTRAPSVKKQIIEALTTLLNANMSDELKGKMAEFKENVKFSMNYDITEKQFTVPTPKVREPGEGGKRGQQMTVDGKDYMSAKSARETLYPDEKGKQKNRAATIAFLKGKGHTIAE
tara:strand:- start:10 stop:558 length:549 start_codon:yes stop_codon:yes gene_type:complete